MPIKVMSNVIYRRIKKRQDFIVSHKNISFSSLHFLYSHHGRRHILYYSIPSILCSKTPFSLPLCPLNKQWTIRVKIKSNFRGHIKISLDRRMVDGMSWWVFIKLRGLVYFVGFQFCEWLGKSLWSRFQLKVSIIFFYGIDCEI